MPSTIDLKKKENVSNEECSMVLKDNEQHEVSKVPVKTKTVLPILLHNGNCVEDAHNDAGKSSFDVENDSGKQIISEFKTRLKFLRVNDQVKELQTTLRDRYEWAGIVRPNIIKLKFSKANVL